MGWFVDEDVVAGWAAVVFDAVMVAEGVESKGWKGEEDCGVEEGVEDEAGVDWFEREDAAAEVGGAWEWPDVDA